MQPSAAGRRRPLLPALQGLRFFAALHVVLLHSFGARWLPGPLRSVVDAGYTSTSLLFILSGFVLVWVYTDAEGRFRGRPWAFWRARATRVYPLSVTAHLLVVPLWIAAGGDGAWVQALAAFSALQGWVPQLANVLNAPAWAVTFLLFAYALFPWMAERVRALSPGGLVAAMAAAWLLAVLPGAVFLWAGDWGETARTALYTFPLLRLPEFAFGVLLGRWFVVRGAAAVPRWAVPAALAAWGAALLGGSYVPRELMHNGLLAPVQGLLVVGLAVGGGAVARALSARPAQKLGEAGLAVFLLHVPLLAWVQALGWLPGGSLATSAVVYAAYLLATVAVSLAAMRWLVNPVAARARRCMERPSPPAQPVARAA